MLKIDYRQDGTFYCAPDDSFSDEVRKTLFEYDESVRSLFLMRIALLKNVRPMMKQMELVPIRWSAAVFFWQRN